MTNLNHNDVFDCIESEKTKQRTHRKVDEMKIYVKECDCGRIHVVEVYDEGTDWEQMFIEKFVKDVTVDDVLHEYGL